MYAHSVSKLGHFWKSWEQILLQNWRNICDIFGGFCEEWHFCKKPAVATFWAPFGDDWATFKSNMWSHWILWKLTCLDVCVVWCKDIKRSVTHKTVLRWHYLPTYKPFGLPYLSTYNTPVTVYYFNLIPSLWCTMKRTMKGLEWGFNILLQPGGGTNTIKCSSEQFKWLFKLHLKKSNWRFWSF